MKKLTVKDQIMLFLAAKDGAGRDYAPIRGRTRLMKMMFIFQKEFLKKFTSNKNLIEIELPDFHAYDYGPFASEVYEALEWLVNMKFVEVLPEQVALSDMETERKELEYWMITSNDGDERRRFGGDVFELSEQGKKFVTAMVPKWGVKEEQWDFLDDFKKRCTETSLSSLLRYVYVNYPEMTEKSKIRHEILNQS